MAVIEAKVEKICRARQKKDGATNGGGEEEAKKIKVIMRRQTII